MKKTMIMLLAALPFAAAAQQQYTVNGTVAKAKFPAMAYLAYQEQGKMRYDSAQVSPDGKFSLKGTVSIPMKAFVMLCQNGENLKSKPSPDQVGIYLENGSAEINTPDSLFRAKIGGTQLNKDQQEMMEQLAPFKKTELQLSADFKKAQGNKEVQAQLEQVYESLNFSRLQVTEGFILGHPNSLVSLNLLRNAISPDRFIDKASSIFDALSPELKATAYGKAYAEQIAKAKSLNIGYMAPDFTLKNPKDQDISLASYKGKYVLVDFWASWCGPCRRENPNVVKAYDKFKAKNFTILGVSLDGGEDAKQKWTDAIAKDGLVWDQVSDLKGWESAVARLYHVNAVPANFLIDPTGKIIGKDLSGEELEAKLAAIL